MRARYDKVALSIAALAMLVSLPVAASPEYPGIIQETLEAKCVPSCTICHDDISGGTGTANKGFARPLVFQNFGAGMGDQLPALLEAYEALPLLPPSECATYGACTSLPPGCDPNPSTCGTTNCCTGCQWLNPDNDCDGMNDVAELREGRDPNTPGVGNLCAYYGCGAKGARVDPHGALDPTSFLAAVGLAGLLGALYRRQCKSR